jgi:hypothetical protein
MKTAALHRSSRRPNLPLLLPQRRPWRGVGVLSVLSSGVALLGSGALGSSRQRRGSRPLVPGRRRGGAPLPFSFPLLLFFLCFSSLCFSNLAAAQRGKERLVVLGGEDADSRHRGAAQLLRCAVASPWRGARRA